MAGGILTLTTDFGADGPYVAAMKGVVLGLVPGTPIVDISHAISPQDIGEGSFVLASIFEYFPPGTVHLAVVDPGVGTSRRVIAVEVAGQFFVLPDNGLISEILRSHQLTAAWEILNPALRRSTVSATFHGRDIMAPAAAHLLQGGNPSDLGPPVDQLVMTPAREPIGNTDGWAGEVIFLDSFGNLITNIMRDHLGSNSSSSWEVEILDQTIEGVLRTYGEQTPGQLVALFGSSNRLEIAVVNGSAARNLAAGRGTPVILRKLREPLV